MNPNLEEHFSEIRKNIIGIDAEFETPFGKQKMLYADWIASGRLYAPIEKKMSELFAPMIGNTHSEASETGVTMTRAYHKAKEIIRKHINANKDDVLITAGAGMTRVVNKFQRILGLRLPDENCFYNRVTGRDLSNCGKLGDDKPVVFVTHFEHHSNHFSWLETISDVVIVPATEDLLFNLENLQKLLDEYKSRKIKIGAFSAGSNVTGYIPPIYEMAKVMHDNGGFCFVDFAASAPYIEIDMHKDDSVGKYFDAIYFSPHKFLGGPGSAAVLAFNRKFYQNFVPDNPGGGTVLWTNPWNELAYVEDIEMREDGGTPAFLRIIRSALAIKLKEQMGVENMRLREHQLLAKAFDWLGKIDKVHILAENVRDRIGVISFYSEKVHHNLMTKLLNDKYGIQVRGGCSCAGPYGHYLFNLDKKLSHLFVDKIMHGDASEKPGWVRISLHPTMTDAELDYVIDAVAEISENIENLAKNYYQDKKSGEWFHNTFKFDDEKLSQWFEL